MMDLLPDVRVNEAIRHMEDLFPGTWELALKMKTWQYSDNLDHYPEMESAIAEIMRRIFESAETLDFVRDEKNEDRKGSILARLVGQIFAAADEMVRSAKS